MSDCPQCERRYGADEHTSGPCRECRHENHAAKLEAELTRLRAQQTVLVDAIGVAIGRFKLIQADGTSPRMRQVIASQGEKEASQALATLDVPEEL